MERKDGEAVKQSEQLRQAKTLIQDPRAWCTSAFAKDKDGKRLENPLDPAACQFCARGALAKVVGKLGSDIEEWLYAFTASVVDLNDNKGHDAVMNLYDLAIAAAEVAEEEE